MEGLDGQIAAGLDVVNDGEMSKRSFVIDVQERLEGFHPTVVWAKLGALVEGARLATARLWNGR